MGGVDRVRSSFLTVTTMRAVFLTLLASLICISVALAPGLDSGHVGRVQAQSTGGNEFIDTATHWARRQITGAVGLGFIQGYGNGRFGPDDRVTRGQFVKMLVVAEAGTLITDAEPSFVDTGEHWVHRHCYLETAVSWGIVVPGEYPDRRFQPDKEISRLEMAVMVVRAIGQEDEAQAMQGAPLAFADADGVPLEYTGHVYLAAVKEIIKGYPDGCFYPDKPATRAQAVVISLRRLDAAPTAGCFKHHRD